MRFRFSKLNWRAKNTRYFCFVYKIQVRQEHKIGIEFVVFFSRVVDAVKTFHLFRLSGHKIRNERVNVNICPKRKNWRNNRSRRQTSSVLRPFCSDFNRFVRISSTDEFKVNQLPIAHIIVAEMMRNASQNETSLVCGFCSALLHHTWYECVRVCVPFLCGFWHETHGACIRFNNVNIRKKKLLIFKVGQLATVCRNMFFTHSAHCIAFGTVMPMPIKLI